MSKEAVKLGKDVLGDMWLIAVRLANLGFSEEEAVRLLKAIRKQKTTYVEIARMGRAILIKLDNMEK